MHAGLLEEEDSHLKTYHDKKGQQNQELTEGTIKLNEQATNVVTGKTERRSFGRPILPCSFEGTSYYGLCDLGSSINVIPYELYLEIENEICAPDIELVDMSIKLADRSLHEPIGVVNNAQIRVGLHTHLIDLVILDVPIDPFCPIVFGRLFLRTLQSYIDLEKKVLL